MNRINLYIVVFCKYKGLKILRWRHRTGPSPVSGTKKWEQFEEYAPIFSVIRGLRTNSRKIRKRRENQNLRMIPNLRRSVFTRRQTERLCKDTVKMSLVFVSRQTDNFFDVQRRSEKQFYRRPQPFFL